MKRTRVAITVLAFLFVMVLKNGVTLADDTTADDWVTSSGDTYVTSGYVGIGTTGPVEKLHIVEENASNYSPSSIGAGANLLLQNSSNNTNGVAGVIFKAKSSSYAYAKIGGEVLSGPDMDMFFQISDSGTISEAMRIKASGNIGIGTISPQSKLAVNGTITTKEVKVTETGWSDFVFKDNYDLPSLE